MGHRVPVAGDGMVVLCILEPQEVDWIAMGVRMPIVDGVEATRKIRGMEKGAGGQVPMVALTATAFERRPLQGPGNKQEFPPAAARKS